jgi:hypothetical protein
MSDDFLDCDILIQSVHNVNSQLSDFQASGILIQPENILNTVYHFYRVIQK